MLNIVIFGAPGSGKGTQSARIVEKYGLNHISTGDVLRAEIKNGTELGKTAKGYIDNGQLIPDALMIDILASVFDSFKDSKGVIFDGFPRTIAQAEALKEMLKVRGQEVSIMLDLEVPEDELMTRLIKRGQESGRADDNEETIKKRLVRERQHGIVFPPPVVVKVEVSHQVDIPSGQMLKHLALSVCGDNLEFDVQVAFNDSSNISRDALMLTILEPGIRGFSWCRHRTDYLVVFEIVQFLIGQSQGLVVIVVIFFP
jgi:adenylate kinase